jgi:quinol monooxygenase YgiN
MIHVLAELRMKEGKLDGFLEMFKELAPAVRRRAPGPHANTAHVGAGGKGEGVVEEMISLKSLKRGMR